MDIGLSVLPAYDIVYEICYIFYNVKKTVNMIASQVIHKYINIYYIYDKINRPTRGKDYRQGHVWKKVHRKP